MDVVIRVVTLPDSEVEFNWRGTTQGLLPAFKELLPVIRMNDGHPAGASVLFRSLAGHFLPAVCFADNITVRCGTPDPRVQGDRERSISFFAVAKSMEGFVAY